jgi:hypothetical protein
MLRREILGGIFIMKKIYFKKAFSIILILFVAITALTSTAFAIPATSGNLLIPDPPAVPDFQHIFIVGATLTINSSGLADCNGFVTTNSTDINTILTVELQRKAGNSWSHVNSWSNSGKGRLTIFQNGQFYIGRGTYRVLATAKVYSPTGILLETAIGLSPEITH